MFKLLPYPHDREGLRSIEQGLLTLQDPPPPFLQIHAICCQYIPGEKEHVIARGHSLLLPLI